MGEPLSTLCERLKPTAALAPQRSPAASLALFDAVEVCDHRRALKSNPIHGQIAGEIGRISNGKARSHLDYAGRCHAETDMNVVMTRTAPLSNFRTAEGHGFVREELDALLNLAATVSANSCIADNRIGEG